LTAWLVKFLAYRLLLVLLLLFRCPLNLPAPLNGLVDRLREYLLDRDLERLLLFLERLLSRFSELWIFSSCLIGFSISFWKYFSIFVGEIDAFRRN
jgi:hypothetical protein